MRSQKRKLIHHADKTIQFILASFLSHPSYGQISRNDAFCNCGCCLEHGCNYCSLLGSEASENQWMAFGVRYLAWRLWFVLDFDTWSTGAKPWNIWRKTSGGQPVVFGLSGTPKLPKVINLPQFKQACLGSVMVNGSTPWVMYQGFVHLDAERRAAELHWSFLFLVNLVPEIETW